MNLLFGQRINQQQRQTCHKESHKGNQRCTTEEGAFESFRLHSSQFIIADEGMNPHRLTAMALMAGNKPTDEISKITDVAAFNQYLGWYLGKIEDNGPWLDEQHAMNPNACLSLSEYGCEAVMKWHSATPKVKGYSEEYQAIYHKLMADTVVERPWMWGSFVWNMFDFAAYARKEGRNNKGLVTYDRKIKKDSYYIYKACWSKDPFVYIAGRRFEKRAPGQRTVQVYTNQNTARLWLNGKGVTGHKKESHIFVFENLPMVIGKNLIEVSADNDVTDQCVLIGVEEPETAYVFPNENPEQENVKNWFGEVLEFPEGDFSIKDSILDINTNAEASAAMAEGLREIIPDESSANQTVMLFAGINAPMTLENILRTTGTMMPPTARSILNQALTKVKK